MTRQECQPVHDDLADLVAGDTAAIARHSEHLASCDDCRDARHDATRLAKLVTLAGADHVAPADLADRVLAALGDDPPLARGSTDTDTPSPSATMPGIAPPAAPPVTTAAAGAPSPEPAGSAPPVTATTAATLAPAPARAPAAPGASDAPVPITSAPRRRTRLYATLAAAAAIAAGAVGVYQATRSTSTDPSTIAAGTPGTVKTIERAAKDRRGGLELRDGATWRVLAAGEQLPAGAEVRTDARTRAAIELADGTRITLDHRTTLAFDPDEPRHAKLSAGRIVADVITVPGRQAEFATPVGKVEVLGTRFALTADDQLAVVQVVRGAVALVSGQTREQVRAGEEGVIDRGEVAVTAAPGLAREVEWAELGGARDTQAGAGLGALRAYKPGESRDRDWNLALANHEVKVRIVGPIARTEITETFRNDSDATLEGVYQFPLPPDAQIDGLALDVEGAPNGFEQGAFLDKQRAQKIWRGVIDKAAPKRVQIARDEIIWVDGSWRDPALLDWKRGGRFELRIFPIPPKGSRTIKIAYTQVVTPRGPWRQYVYPLPHSADGSTVADRFAVDVEIRGARPGQVRTLGYDLNPDPARAAVNARAFQQTGFVPRGDLVVAYRATDGDAELRAWTFAGGFAVAPDAKLAEKQHVGIDPKVIAAQRAVAADARPTAVLALKPELPRWREARSRDYALVIDASQSMVGERFARAGELARRLVEQMDRRDRFAVLACDSECRSFPGALRAPSIAAADELAGWLAREQAAGASDVVAAIRAAAAALPETQGRERWVIYVGDGFASTGFRKPGDVEQAIAQTRGVSVTTIGIGTDADAAVLAAAARGGGGSYLAWVPGQSVKSAAIAGLESTFGTALRDARVELPAGLADVAPAKLPTIRAGEEVLVAARITGAVAGDVVLKGSVGGQPFEQRYPIKLAVSTAPGNGFVPRLWASLAIAQLERRGAGDDRAKIVALSQGYGVMSKETSLLVLESAAMFEAFGVDRTVPAAKWTGQEALDEVLSSGTVRLATAGGKAKPKRIAVKGAMAPRSSARAAGTIGNGAAPTADFAQPRPRPGGRTRFWGGGFAMRRTWVRVPSVSAYDKVHPAIVKAIGDAERALARAPDSRERHRALVQALSYAGELDRANQLAQAWLERDRLDPQALGYQADLLGRDGQRELALRTLAGVVDLGADRAASHERMIRAYEHVGRMTQACSHRIALAAIETERASAAAGAIRCLRTLARERDAELVRRGVPDALRAELDKALVAPPPAASRRRDLVIDARWEGGDDLDVSLVTPHGTRVSWMGGRDDVHVTGATSTTGEQLVVAALKRGHYLIEIGRGGATPGTAPVRGTLEIRVLGTRRSLAFELTGTRTIVARLGVSLQERLETIDPSATKISFGNIPNPRARRVMLARIPSIRACFASLPGASGTMILTVVVSPNGRTTTRARGGGAIAPAARCVEQRLASMHVEGSAAGTFRVPLRVRAR